MRGRGSEGAIGEWSGYPSCLARRRNIVSSVQYKCYQLIRTPHLPVVDWTVAPAESYWLVRFTERWTLVSVRVTSNLNCAIPDDNGVDKLACCWNRRTIVKRKLLCHCDYIYRFRNQVCVCVYVCVCARARAENNACSRIYPQSLLQTSTYMTAIRGTEASDCDAIISHKIGSRHCITISHPSPWITQKQTLQMSNLCRTSLGVY
jgi:hypothetical protein